MMLLHTDPVRSWFQHLVVVSRYSEGKREIDGLIDRTGGVGVVSY